MATSANLRKSISHLISRNNRNRSIVFNLAKQSFKSKYLGSYLGILWAFIHPAIMICIFWFVFEVGFKSVPVDNYPFLLWFMAGIIPWFYFSEAIPSSTNSIVDNAYLVKKVVFPIHVLPIISVVSSLFVHLFFISVLVLLFIKYGYSIDIYVIQIIFYLIMMILLMISLSYFTSTIIVFFKDLGQIVAMCIQLGFWLTPIFWTLDMLPEKFHFFVKLNPMYYIVEGYRDALIYKVWFWEKPLLTTYFSVFLLVSLLIGSFLFKRLKPHFADVI